MPPHVMAHTYPQFYAELRLVEGSYRPVPIGHVRLGGVLSHPALSPSFLLRTTNQPNPILEHLLAWRRSTQVEQAEFRSWSHPRPQDLLQEELLPWAKKASGQVLLHPLPAIFTGTLQDRYYSVHFTDRQGSGQRNFPEVVA